MNQSTLTAKGRTTVPAEVRARVRAEPGTRLVWSVLPDGTILVRTKSRSLRDLAGSVAAPAGKHVSIAAMKAWRR